MSLTRFSAALRTASRSSSFARGVSVRSFGDYVQPPLSQGEGGKPNVIADDSEQATGREREELKAFAQGESTGHNTVTCLGLFSLLVVVLFYCS